MVYVLRTHAVESDEIVRSFWELESMGISESIDECFQLNTTIQRFEKTIRFLNGRYEVALPWKDGFDLSDNKQVATTRLRRLLCRLSKNEVLLKMYDKTREYLESGHAEVVETPPSNPENLYYMPPREVIREQALTTKMRIVFDASSHARGCKSLNECLEKETTSTKKWENSPPVPDSSHRHHG